MTHTRIDYRVRVSQGDVTHARVVRTLGSVMKRASGELHCGVGPGVTVGALVGAGGQTAVSPPVPVTVPGVP